MSEGIGELRQQGHTLRETIQEILDDADLTQAFLREKMAQDNESWPIDRAKITEISLLLDSMRTLAGLYMEGLDLLEQLGLGENSESGRERDLQ